MTRETAVWLVGAGWLAVIAGGFWAWERYDATPGAARSPQPEPAVESEPRSERWRLTVFVHPRCPCSRAALDELAEIAHAAPDLATRVLFVLPPGVEPGWARGESWDEAGRIAGSERVVDSDGAEAVRLGAETSGHAVLTDPAGRAVFRGGLTQARGRAGESPGRRAVLDWVRGCPAAPSAPVFGCPLQAPGA